MEIVEIHQDKRIDKFFTDRWGSDFIVSKGERLYGRDLDGFAVFDGQEIIGLLTYHVKNNSCEIVSLDSLSEKQGTGTALIEAMIEKANEMKIHWLWLMTTNDNTAAMRFYQKRGFVFKALYPDAIEESRKLKQNIPEIGNDDIPIRDEIELEFPLIFGKAKSKSVLARTNFANVVVGVVIEKDNKFLMMQESKPDVYGKWNFPAGKVEVGENIIDSAKREALEESGYDVELTGLISVYYINWDNNDGITVRYNFKAKLIDENQTPKELADDVLKTEWMTISEIQKLSVANELRSPNTVHLANEVEAGKIYPLDILYTS